MPPRARVLLNEPVGLLDYRIPEHLTDSLQVGLAVRVPLGTRRTSAYVVGFEDGPLDASVELKDIEALDLERPPLPAPLLQLIVFAAAYYGVAPGDMLNASIPPLKRSAAQRYRMTSSGRWALETHRLRHKELAILQVAAKHEGGFTVRALEREVGISRREGQTKLKRMEAKGWVESLRRKSQEPKQLAAYRRVVTTTPHHPSGATTTKTEQAVLQLIPHEGDVTAVELAQQNIPNLYAKLKALTAKGYIERTHVLKRRLPYEPVPLDDLRPTPTAEQQEALAALMAALHQAAYKPFLLHGVTGSGKTEIYLQLIERCLALGKNALMLVPEIALTPQLGEQFRRRFGANVATFHSGLTAAERRDEWERVATGKARIGLGARSALFLPFSNVGVIIVDEEHEASFKQDESPRYNARDLALVRGQKERAVVVLGSATPSLESHANCVHGRYHKLTLASRVHQRPMPQVERVPMADAKRVGEGIFSHALALRLEEVLRRGEQAILFLNRRGFAPYVQCKDCGLAYRCTDCDVGLTLHRKQHVLLCHYCGYQEAPPDACKECHSHRVDAFGLGTEKLEAELRNLFGTIGITRLDRDTIRRRADLENALEHFRSQKTQVMVGTQMVAKGHDFPSVTLVGVMAADAALNFPDFRAAERTFQLLTQVSGRAGRANKPGMVMVQAYDMHHYAIETAATHDFAAFIEKELSHRAELAYPPYSHLALMRFAGTNEAQTLEQAHRYADQLRKEGPADLMVLGPAPAPIARVKNFYRVHVLLKSLKRSALRYAIRLAPKEVPDVRRMLDVDPINML